MIRWHSIDEFPNMKAEFEKEAKIEFQKSLLSDLDEDEEYDYIDSFGVRRRKKGRELKGIDVSEISFVDFPATRKKFYVMKNEKGDDIMELEEAINMEDEKAVEAMTPGEVKTLQTAIAILSKHKVTGDLEKARAILQKNFGKGAYPYPYPVKKSNNFYWSTAERQIFGYNQDDLSMIKDSEPGEIQKSSDDDPFPSLSRQFNLNQARIEKRYEERNAIARAV